MIIQTNLTLFEMVVLTMISQKNNYHLILLQFVNTFVTALCRSIECNESNQTNLL